MAVRQTFTIDTSQAQENLYNISNYILSIKGEANSITLNPNLTETLSQTNYKLDSAKNTLKTISINPQLKKDIQDINVQLDRSQKTLKKMQGTTIDGNKASLQSIKQTMAGLKGITGESTTGLARIKSFVTGMFSVWTAVFMAFQLAMKGVTYLFNNLTDSFDKLIARTQNSLKTTQKHNEELKKQREEAKKLVDTLENLNKKTSLTSAEQVQAQVIIEKLSKKYKGLKISIDEATGSLIGFKNAQQIINNQDKREELQSLSKDITDQKALVDAKIKQLFGTGNIGLGQKITGAEFFTTAEALGNTVGYQNRQLLAKMWNSGDLEQQLKALEQVVNNLSQNEDITTKGADVLEAFRQLVDTYRKRNQLLNPNNIILGNTEAIIKANQQLIKEAEQASKKLDQLLNKKNELEQQSQFDNLDVQQQIDRLKEQANAIKQEISDLQITVRSTDEDVQQRADEVRRASESSLALSKQIQEAEAKVAQYKRKYAKLQTDIQQQRRERQEGDARNRSFKDQLIKEMQTELNQFSLQKNAVEAELGALRARLNSAEEERAHVETDKAQTDKQNAEAKKNLADAELRLAQKNLQIKKKQEQLQKIRQQERQALLAQQQLEQQQQQNFDNFIKSYQDQQQIAMMKLLGEEQNLLYFEALRNAEKAKGAELTKKQIEAVKEYVDRLQRIDQQKKLRDEQQKQQDAINDVFKGYDEKQATAYLKLLGKQKESLLLEAKINAEKAKGAKLTEEELKSLQNYIDTEMLLEDIKESSKLQLNSRGVIADQLAKKGGDLSSVVMDRAQDVNKQILAEQIKQTNLTDKLNSTMQKNNTLIEKMSVIQ